MKKGWLAIVVIIWSCTACFKDSEVDERVERIRAAKRAPGISSKEILSADPFEKIQLEIQYMEGYAPSSSTVTDLKEWLVTLVNKPAGVEVVTKEIPALGQEEYTLQEVRAIEDENRSAYNSANELGLYILILDGYYDKDTETEASLGFAHRNTSIALMGKRVSERSGGVANPSKALLETTVLEHEIGHLMGLVNLGAAMQADHEDEENHGHCDDEECLMYWEVETFHIYGSKVPELDENCRNDLKAMGGK